MVRDIPTHIDFKYNMKVYLGFLKKYKGLFALLVLFVLLVEAASVADKWLFKKLIDDGTLYAAGTLTQNAFVNSVMIIIAVFIAIYAVRAISSWFQSHFLNLLETQLMADLKRKYFNHIVGLSMGFHTTHKTGSLISRMTRGGRAIERMTDVFIFNVFPLLFQLIIISASLIFLDWLSALILLGTVGAFILYSYVLQMKQRPYSIMANNTEDIEKGQLADMLTNIESVKYFGKERHVEKKFFTLTDNTRKAVLDYWNYYRMINAGQVLILGIGTVLLIYFSLVNFLAGEMTLGTMVFIFTVYGNLLHPLLRFVYGMREYNNAMADFESLFEYGKIENDIVDKPDAKNLKIAGGSVEFKDVGFKYGSRHIFNGFNLKIPKNKKIALVGHSGSGKTTLVKLLYRMYDVDSGKIMIDGKDIRDFRQESVRSEMSIVPQEAVLFDDTIYNNVAFSRPEATRNEIMQAIKFAQLDKIISEFPQKEETIVGERGVKLSGGEKQRVSIARALLADKKILVLDEATSSLDSQTEHDIQRDLKSLMRGRTTIIIAHRLSTIMSADIIVVLKRGKIVQMGTHGELIAQKGEYRKLWNLQKGGYIK